MEPSTWEEAIEQSRGPVEHRVFNSKGLQVRVEALSNEEYLRLQDEQDALETNPVGRPWAVALASWYLPTMVAVEGRRIPGGLEVLACIRTYSPGPPGWQTHGHRCIWVYGEPGESLALVKRRAIARVLGPEGDGRGRYYDTTATRAALLADFERREMEKLDE